MLCACVLPAAAPATPRAAADGAATPAPRTATAATAPSRPARSRRARPSTASTAPRAFALLREQVEDYGWRPAGSPALRRLAVRLRALLPRGRFEDVPGHPGLRNVVGSVPGRMPAIVVGAHYDVEAAPEGFVGANDGAAGTAAVVTLARAFARAPRPRNARALRFVLFDGEEEPAGCEPFLDVRPARLDGLRRSATPARRARSSCWTTSPRSSGLRFPREGGSDAALWAQLRRAARAVGVGALFSGATSAGRSSTTTRRSRSAASRAIDLIDFDYPQRDSLDDDLDAVSQRSLDAVGEAVYRLVARLRVEPLIDAKPRAEAAYTEACDLLRREAAAGGAARLLRRRRPRRADRRARARALRRAGLRAQGDRPQQARRRAAARARGDLRRRDRREHPARDRRRSSPRTASRRPSTRRPRSARCRRSTRPARS